MSYIPRTENVNPRTANVNPRTANVNPRTENVNFLKTMKKKAAALKEKAAALKKKAKKKLGKFLDKHGGTDSGVQSEQSLKAHGKQFIPANKISNT